MRAGTLQRRQVDLQQTCTQDGKRSPASLSTPLLQLDQGRLVGIGHTHRHNKTQAHLYHLKSTVGAGRQYAHFFYSLDEATLLPLQLRRAVQPITPTTLKLSRHRTVAGR